MSKSDMLLSWLSTLFSQKQRDLQPVNAHARKLFKNWAMPVRRINDHLLFVVGQGRIQFEVGGKKINLVPYQGILVSPKTVHHAEYLGETPYILSVRFLYPKKAPGSYHLIQLPSLEPSKPLFEQLVNAFQAGWFGGRPIVPQSILIAILYEVYLAQSNPKKAKADPRVNAVCQAIRDKPFTRQSVQLLSQKAGLNPKYFSRLFKSQKGLSPKAYQLNQRLEKAHDLLEHTGMRVCEIAEKAGYADPFTFSKQFKARFGCSPKAVQARII